MSDNYPSPVDAELDIPDSRDLIYRPGLTTLGPEIDPRRDKPLWCAASRVRDQKQAPSCTGHALAAAIDHLLAIERVSGAAELEPSAERLKKAYASAFMLYGNAQLHDEWHGEGYSGSSLRGAIKGFHHNGVCSIETARAVMEKSQWGPHMKGAQQWRWHTNAAVTNEARHAVLGAYYRVRPQLTDMHCAIAESRVLVATARIHDGWYAPGEQGVIPFDSIKHGNGGDPEYHAFVVLGYTSNGFLIQNSWGDKWGEGGFAIWTYEDWSRNVADVWALRLAAPLPGTFRYSVGLQGVSGVVSGRGMEGGMRSAPTRLDVLGHLLPIVDGKLQRHGPFHHDPTTIAETIRIIETRHSEEKAVAVKKAGKKSWRYADAGEAHKLPAKDLKYHHVLIHVLAGSRSETDAARYVRALHPVYRENGIYPVFLHWEPALFEELRKQVDSAIDTVNARAQPGGTNRDAMIARLAEIEAAGIPGRLRRELERSIRRFFYFMVPDPETTPDDLPREITLRNADGIRVMDDMFKVLKKRHRAGTLSYHLVGHDLGVRFMAELLSGSPQDETSNIPVFSTMHLVSPLIEQRRFNEQIVPALARSGEGKVNRKAKRRQAVVEQTYLWCLDEDAAKLDKFHPGYPMNWPNFWARVLGVMIKRDKGFRDGMQPGRRYEEIDESNRFPVMKSLAIEKYADEAVIAAQEQGACIEIQKVRITDEEFGDIGHATLDGSSRVVKAILESILGKDGVRRHFSELDWQLSR